MGSQKTKIIVAMSGGVDSSAAAAILKRANFNVSGVFIKLWRGKKESEKMARQVAKKLGITLRVFNFEKEFKKRIVSYFLSEYGAGRTPNPCVVCNKEIKFGLLLEKSLALGADFVATGHYARLRNGKLLRAKDKNKDQSYFLWQLGQEQLRHVLFPLANYTKSEVRKTAKKFGLPSAEAPDSQEVCFVSGTINDFLAKYLKQKEGKIVDAQGKILGVHQGLIFYTIGQRKGINLSQGPYWVSGKDLKKNLLVVTKNKKDLFKSHLTFKNSNWLSGKTPRFPMKIRIKIRHRSDLVSAVLFKNKVIFDNPQRAITPGQSAVFFRDQELLGGGVIV